MSAKGLADFIKRAVSPYHTVEESRRLLEAAGFEALDMHKSWRLTAGGRYYVIPYKTALFAFTVPEGAANAAVRQLEGQSAKCGAAVNKVKYTESAGGTVAAVDTDNGFTLHIAAAHTDFPCLHVKPAAELVSCGYMRVNTEIYGGPILNTWLDRPLSLAGRVLLKSDDIYAPREVLVDFARPVLTIPNLAVHYNREVNKGVELTKQNDMLPLLGMLDGQLNRDSYFLDFVADEIGEPAEDILDFDLIVYNAEQPAFIGMNGELLSSPRLDNITSCYALVQGLIAAGKDGAGICGSNPAAGQCAADISGANVGAAAGKAENERRQLSMIALFDNEEIGSGTKQGADSALLGGILKRIYAALGRAETELERDIAGGFLLSVDVAHALHPAKAEKYDPVNNMRMGEGVTFKLSANQRYSYDAVAVASLQQLCDSNGIRYRKFVNHADMPGGGTLGPIISSWLPMHTVDIGVPILAMHSARELMGADDQAELEKLIEAFFR